MQSQKTKDAADEALRFNLFKIIREGEVRRLEELLEARRSMTDTSQLVNINQTRWSGWTPLHRAAELGYTDIIELLIENGAKIGESLMFNHNMIWLASVSLIEKHTIFRCCHHVGLAHPIAPGAWKWILQYSLVPR